MVVGRPCGFSCVIGYPSALSRSGEALSTSSACAIPRASVDGVAFRALRMAQCSGGGAPGDPDPPTSSRVEAILAGDLTRDKDRSEPGNEIWTVHFVPPS